MEPIARFMRLYQERYVVDDIYKLDVHEDRSPQSHNFYFARLHELWQSLPDALALQFPNETVLRRHALCMCGFRREKKWVCSSREEARKLAAWLQDDPDDENYALISVAENVVVKWTPLSQSRKGMPTKGQFEDSKRKVLEWIEDLIGVRSEAA